MENLSTHLKITESFKYNMESAKECLLFSSELNKVLIKLTVLYDIQLLKHLQGKCLKAGFILHF